MQQQQETRQEGDFNGLCPHTQFCLIVNCDESQPEPMTGKQLIVATIKRSRCAWNLPFLLEQLKIHARHSTPYRPVKQP
jgi:hypothetical protein